MAYSVGFNGERRKCYYYLSKCAQFIFFFKYVDRFVLIFHSHNPKLHLQTFFNLSQPETDPNCFLEIGKRGEEHLMKLLQLNELRKMHMKEEKHRAMNTKSYQKDNKKSYAFTEYQDHSIH